MKGERFLSKEEYLKYIKDRPDLFIWKTYENYIKNSKDGIPLLDISRQDIIKTKEILKKDYKQRGMIAYDEMLKTCLEHPMATSRMCMIPGTRKLLIFQNFIIIFNRILTVIGIILLSIFIFSKFSNKIVGIIGSILLITDYILSAILQTEINFELAARLVTLDQKMNGFDFNIN